MTAGIILQARVTSKRFPNKCLATLNGKPVIDWILEACDKSGLPICVAIPQNKTNDALENYLALRFKTTKFKSGQPTLFRGSEEDVTARYIGANNAMKFDPIVRICSDCPYLLPDDIKLALEIFEERNYFTWLNHVQVFSAAELQYANQNDWSVDSRQHVLGRFGHDTVEFPEDMDRFNTISDEDPTLRVRRELWKANLLK